MDRAPYLSKVTFGFLRMLVNHFDIRLLLHDFVRELAHERRDLGHLGFHLSVETRK